MRLLPPFGRSVLGFLSVVALASADESAVTGRDVYYALRNRGIPMDGARIEAATVDAMLQTVDDRAQILTRGDVSALRTNVVLAAAEDVGGNIFYVKVAGLYEEGATAAVSQVRASARMPGMILDLRGSTGQGLAAVDRFAALAVPPGRDLYRVVDARGATASVHRVTESVGPVATPMMVLVNEGTRDTAELLAGILKGCTNVMLLGSRTFGDDRYREPIPLPNGSFLYVSTGRVIPVAGPYVHTGVEPHVSVSSRVEDSSAQHRRSRAEYTGCWSFLLEGDAVLQRAVDILVAMRALTPDGTVPANAVPTAHVPISPPVRTNDVPLIDLPDEVFP